MTAITLHDRRKRDAIKALYDSCLTEKAFERIQLFSHCSQSCGAKVLANERTRVDSKVRASIRIMLLFALAHCMCAGSLLNPVACLASSPQSVDEALDPDQFSHSFWGAAQGAPQSIWTVTQSSDGMLWLATAQGLYSFDGIHFQRFKSANNQELPSTNVVSVFCPKSGGLWIGYQFGGFSFIQNGQIHNFVNGSAEEGGAVFRFAQNRNGDLWAATTGGLMRFTNGEWQLLGPEWDPPPGPAHALGFDREGRLWALCRYSIFFLEPNATRFRAVPDLSMEQTWRFALWPDGTVWTHRVAPDALVPGQPKVSPLFSGKMLDSGTFNFIDRTGSMWLFNDKISQRFATSEDSYAQPDMSRFRSIQTFRGIIAGPPLVDREGNIWMVSGDGLHRLSYTALRVIHLKEHERAPAISPSSNGAVYVGVTAPEVGPKKEPLYQVSAKSLDKIRGFDDPVTCLYAAPDGSTWIGNTTLWHLKDGNFISIDTPSELTPTGAHVQAMTADREGSLWVSFVRGGIYRLSNGSWTKYGGRLGLPSVAPLMEYTDSDGYLWFGFTRNRLARFRNGKADTFDPSDGLDIGNVTAIQVSGAEIWAGGESGLTHFDHGRFHRLNAVDPESLRGITGMIRMPNGDLWLNGISGIVHLQAKELQLSIADNKHPLAGQRFSREDGLSGYAPQVRPLPSAIQGSDGRLWFTTNIGVFWLDPSRAVKPTLSPLVSIRSVTADGKQQTPDAPLALPAGTSNVRIEYDAVNLSEPESVHYRYKLQGSGADWLDASEQTYVSYLNLKPGAYTFLVEATDNNGVWSESPASLSMRILPAFYQTWWFPLLLASVVLLCIYVVFRIRIEQNAKQVRLQYEARLTERTRVARDLHDTFMQTVQASKMAVDQARSRPPDALLVHPALNLEQLSGWLGRATEEGRAALNSLRAASADECDLPESLRRAIDECRMQRVEEFSFLVTGEVRETYPAVRDEIYRIAYEAISNACAHSKANRLIVRLTYASDLTVSVMDDGIGIEPSIAEKGREGHFGLLGMRERVARINGKLTVVSSPERGTEIIISVPGKLVFCKATLKLPTRLKLYLEQLRESAQQD